MKRQRSRSLILKTLPYILLIFVWLYFAVLNAIPYWQHEGDYSWYALSHAFTLESKLAGDPASNFGYNVHPGVPFGVACWVALRLSTLGIGDSGARIAYAATHAESFWLWAKIIALTLNLLGLLLLNWIFRESVLLFIIAFGLYFAATPATFSASLTQLTNESFALVFVVSYYFISYRLLTSFGSSDYSIKSANLPGSTQDFLSFILGVLAALGCSLKIYYTAPAFGFFFGIATAVILGVFSIKAAVRIILLFVSGFLLTGFLIVFFILGWPAFTNWISWNWQMLSHSDRYGTGEKGFIKFRAVMSAIGELSFSTKGSLPAVFIALAIFTFTQIRKNIKDRIWVNTYIPFSAVVLIGISINLLGLLKHYTSHYALPLCASLPCLLLIVDRRKLSRDYLIAGVTLITALVILCLHNFSSIHTSSVQRADAAIRDVEVINSLPISKEKRRVWGYFSPSEGGVLPLIQSYAGSTLATQVLQEVIDPIDTSPIRETDLEKWKYVIFPKKYFPTRESILENYPKQFDFAATQFKLQEADKISELEMFFVLTRTAENSDEG